MAYFDEIKFFIQEEEVYSALFDKPPFFCTQFWIKNISLKEMGISKLPNNLELEVKYRVEDLGLKSFYATKPEFEFVDKLAEVCWKIRWRTSPKTFIYS